MYKIYTSLGLIISSKNIGESDKLLSVFTKEKGLINILAHGIRYEKSKLRYHCQELTFSNLSFVRGKEFYKLTGAESICGKWNHDDPRIKIFIRFSKIIKRLVHGELALEKVFDDLYSIVDIDIHVLTKESDIVESVIIFRALYVLGYIKTNAELKSIVDMPLHAKNILEQKERRRDLNKFINQALKESQL